MRKRGKSQRYIFKTYYYSLMCGLLASAARTVKSNSLALEVSVGALYSATMLTEYINPGGPRSTKLVPNTVGGTSLRLTKASTVCKVTVKYRTITPEPLVAMEGSSQLTRTESLVTTLALAFSTAASSGYVAKKGKNKISLPEPIHLPLGVNSDHLHEL